MTRTLRAGFDTVIRISPLGVQFRDVLDLGVVSDGLRVELLDAQRPDRARRLTAGPSGVFVAHSLPGMHGFGDPVVTSPSTGAAARFSLSVRDMRERYLDTSVALSFPAGGLFQPACMQGSPQDGPRHVPLYSACTRPVPTALAVVRANLRAASEPGRPASWARLELWLGAVRLATGLADENGTVLLLGPLPPPREPTRRASPPADADRLAWDVSLRAYWNAAHRATPVPELCELQTQPEVGLLGARATSTPLGLLQLRADRPLMASDADSPFLFVAA